MSDRMQLGKTLLRAFLFAAIFLAINAGLSRLYRSYFLSQTVIEKQLRQYKRLGSEASILVLGDSHAMRGIHPPSIGPCFNFATPGEIWTQSYYKLKHVVDNSLSPVKAVILPFEQHSFSSFRAHVFEKPYFWKPYVNYIDVAWTTGRWAHYTGLFLGSHVAYVSGVDDLIEWLPNRGQTRPMQRGFIGNKLIFSRDDTAAERVANRIRRHFTGHQIVDETLAYFFVELLEYCSEKGIHVVLVKFPVTSSYYQAVDEIVDIEAFYRQMEGLIEPDHQVTILDYQREFFGRDDLFNSPDHLNTPGAIQVSRRVAADLRRLGLLP